MQKDNIIKALKEVTGEGKVHLEFPEQETYGDYATNIAMVLAKRKKRNPGQLAHDIKNKLTRLTELTKIVSKIEVAGAGFINFWLSKRFLLAELDKTIKEGDDYGLVNIGKGKTVLVEYSSPNIAKYFGIGHLRSTIIGQALYNLYDFLGYKTIGDNHIGDWGTQFGVLLAQITKAQGSPKSYATGQAKLSKAWPYRLKAKNLTLEDLERMYVEFNKRAKDDPELWEEAREWFKKLEEGDKNAREIWNSVRKVSLTEFDRIYKIMGVKIDNAFGESFYEDKMQAVIEEVRKKGLSKKSEGAEIVEFPSTRSARSGPSVLPPAMLLKSDGTTTYYTRDLATIKYRIEKFKPILILYEVGSEQSLHFKQVFKTAEMLGWLSGTKLVHVAHGLIRLPQGKMSTRTGQTVRLENILNEAKDRAEKIINKSKTSRGLSIKEKDEVSKKVGIGAIKYFDLMHHPTSDIIFNWEKMFVLEGNSAPYLQYTVARTQSVLRKAQSEKQKAKSIMHLALSLKLNAEEESLLRQFPHFSEVIEDAAKSYSPNLLCNYLFDLAQKFNAFYSKYKIIEPEVKGQEGKKVKELRMALTIATGQILKNGLNLLGIDHPAKM